MAARRCGSQDQIVFLNLFSFVYEIVICFPYDVSLVGGLSGDSDMAGRDIWCGGGFAAVCDFFVRRERKASIIVHHHPSLARNRNPSTERFLSYSARAGSSESEDKRFRNYKSARKIRA